MCSCVTTKTWGSSKGVLRNNNPKKEPICLQMYNDLRGTDLKIINEIKKDKKNVVLKNLSSQIRVWIKNLKYECPPEIEYINLKVIVENVNTNP